MESSLKEYAACLISGERIYFLAENIEQAAWDAMKLAEASNDILNDVIPTELLYVREKEDQEILPAQD